MYVYVMYVTYVCMHACPRTRHVSTRTLESSNAPRCGLDQGSNAGVDEIFHAVQTGFEAHPSAIPWVPNLFQGQKGRNVVLTTHSI